MKIIDAKRKYKNYKVQTGERNIFTVADYNDENGKILVVMNYNPYYGRTVVQGVRLRDGKELLADGACRPCDNIQDAVDVLGEMEWCV